MCVRSQRRQAVENICAALRLAGENADDARWTVERGERSVETRAIDFADFKEEAVVKRIDVVRARNERTQVQTAIGKCGECIAQRPGAVLDFDCDATE
jgi:hypothetical protein